MVEVVGLEPSKSGYAYVYVRVRGWINAARSVTAHTYGGRKGGGGGGGGVAKACVKKLIQDIFRYNSFIRDTTFSHMEVGGEEENSLCRRNIS